MGQAITAAMGELQQAVYQGGEDVGMQLSGPSDWGEFAETIAGSKETAGANIGMSGELTVAVGADGQLVNQARNRAPGDAPSTHVLKIDVRPTVTFGIDGNVPIVRWIANVSVFELTKARMVIGESSADDEAERALAGKRPVHEYMNDPEYKAAVPGFLHETPREAVRAALQKIASSGRVNLPDPPDPASSAPVAPTPEPATAAPESGGGRPGWLLPLVGMAGMVVVLIAILSLTGGGDSEPGGNTDETSSGLPSNEVADELDEGDEELGRGPGVEATSTAEPAAADAPRQIQIGGPVFGDSGPSAVDMIGFSVDADGFYIFTFPAEAIAGQRHVAVEALGATSDRQEWFTECGIRPEESKFLCLSYDNQAASQYYGQKERTLAEQTNPDGSFRIPSVFQLVDGEIIVRNYDDGNCPFCVADRGDVMIRELWFATISTGEDQTTGQIDKNELQSAG
jgi:hypothetical protein